MRSEEHTNINAPALISGIYSGKISKRKRGTSSVSDGKPERRRKSDASSYIDGKKNDIRNSSPISGEADVEGHGKGRDNMGKTARRKGNEERIAYPFPLDEGEEDGRNLKKRKREIFAVLRKKREERIKRPSLYQRAQMERQDPRYGKKRSNRLSKFISKLGYTKVFVEGKNGYKALAAISKICRVSDVNVASDGVSFLIPSKVCLHIIAILDSLCYNYKIINSIGALPRFARTATRIGFAMGIAIAIAAAVVYQGFITSIGISGVSGDIDGALNSQIIGILTERGIERGKYVGRVDISALEREILQLDSVAYVGIRRQGTHLTVAVKREQPPEAFLDIKGSTVTAKELATVTRIVVEGGTAVKSYGDIVRTGDVLIDGYVMYGDERIDVEAKGIAYGKVYLANSVFFPDEPERIEYGRVKRVTVIGIGGRHRTPKPPFEDCETLLSVTKYGFLIPLEVYSYEFRERVVVKGRNTLSDDEMVKSVCSGLMAGLESNAKLLEVKSDIRRTEGGAQVSVVMAVEKIIT